jgi:uncharacterized protein
MEINDRLYGKIEVTDPIVLEIINTNAFQRLKRINQYGGVNFIYPDRFQTTRFEHSIAVWHILHTLGASEEAQIVGLLHDVGHLAFSHMVDQAMESETENYHETIMHLMPGMDEIKAILKKNDIKMQNVDTYPEIKKSLPDIGADRLDYAMRDYVAATGEETDIGKRVLDSIELNGRDIVFTDLDVAVEFSLKGVKAMWEVIYEPSVAVVYQSLIEMIRLGMKEGWLKEEALFGDDAAVLEILKKNREKYDRKYIDIFEKKFTVEPSSEAEADLKHVKLKARYFDPFVKTDKGLKQASELSPKLKAELEKMSQIFEERKGGVFYRIVFTQK